MSSQAPAGQTVDPAGHFQRIGEQGTRGFKNFLLRGDIVVPYKHIQARRGQTVFGDPPDVKTCPYCLSDDLPAAASKCKYCGSEQPATA
jgi:hypothetical protein